MGARNGDTRAGRGEAPRSWRSLSASALVAGLLIAISVLGSASAQDPLPPTPSPSSVTQGLLDTQLTQVPQPSDQWSQVAGQIFSPPGNAPGAMKSEITPKTTDFFTVNFHNALNGYAAGADCVTPDIADDQLAQCPTRVPVIYGYSDPDGVGGAWTKVDLPGGDKPGYVAGIAFLGAGRVLAVGGDGKYPRREDNPTTVAGDAAGHARAWLLDQGQWEELSNLPSDMRGMTALDASPRAGDCGPGASECAYAGALQQLWRFNDGTFTPAMFEADDGTPTTTVPADLRYRVRSLRFFPGSTPPPTAAVAVTAGCCAGDAITGPASVLWLDAGRWHVALLQGDRAVTVHNGTDATAFTVKNVTDSVALQVPEPVKTLVKDEGYGLAQTIADSGRGLPNGPDTQTLADSYYAIVPTANAADSMSVIASPGGPPQATDPNSTILARETPQKAKVNGSSASGGTTGTILHPVFNADGDWSANSHDGYEVLRAMPSGFRLVAGDGDFTGPGKQSPVPGSPRSPASGPDGAVDWAVGQTTSDDQAVAYSTTIESADPTVPDPLDCGGQPQGTNCKPRDQDGLSAQVSSKSTFALTSYGLNAISMPEASVAWAVGDRGALERLGGSSAGGGGLTPDAPQLGAHDASPLPDTTPYDPFAPTVSGKPGAVPPLGAQPLDNLAEPTVISGGSPDPEATHGKETIGAVVSGRDGSESWGLGAIGSGGAPMTLEHRVDGEWRRCGAVPVNRQLPADAACSGLADLFPRSGSPAGFTAAARIPLENDSDPSNDDEFQAVAVGGGVTYPGRTDNKPLLAWYRDGRWKYDAEGGVALAAAGTAPASVAFSSPDDGWVTFTGSSATKVAHYDGKSWHICDTANADAACFDLGKRILSVTGTTGFGMRVVAAGSREFLYAMKQNGDSTVSSLLNGQDPTGANIAPYILTRETDKPCKVDTDPGCWNIVNGGYDPGSSGGSGQFSLSDGQQALSVVQNADGSYSGWAVGKFAEGSQTSGLLQLTTGPDGKLSWHLWSQPDAAADYLGSVAQPATGTRSFTLAVLPGKDAADSRALVALISSAQPVLEFTGSAWRPLAMPFSTGMLGLTDTSDAANLEMLAGDGVGGAWIEVHPREGGLDPVTLMYHYTRNVRRPVLREVAHPIRAEVTGAAGGPDGSFWVVTSGSTVYRYSRLTGWDSMTVKGWDPGHLVTHASPAYAIAIGPDGKGLVVGQRGRIADLSPVGAILDEVAGGAKGGDSGQGTTQDLRAVAVAPDGSALAGGEGKALLWRDGPDGTFAPVDIPVAGPQARLTGIAMPSRDHAWVTAGTGQIFAGELGGGGWNWRVENRDANGDVLNLGVDDHKLGLRAIALDAGGRGYAVGDNGLLLERTGQGPQPWRRVETGFTENLDSVTLAPGGGALIGGWGGLVLTLDHGRFQVVRQPDIWDPVAHTNAGFAARIAGLAILPGQRDGQVEAWAAEQVPYDTVPGASTYNRNPAPTAILHYSSDPTDPLLSPDARIKAGEDSVKHVAGELSFAAFGKSDCPGSDATDFCAEPLGTNLTSDVISRRVVEDVSTASHQPGGPGFALFTGDVSDAASRGNESNGIDPTNHLVFTPADDSAVHKRWAERVVAPLGAAGVPLFAAIGGQDLSGATVCQGNLSCAGAKRVGLTLPWRQALAAMPAPWGSGKGYPATASGYTFVPAPGTGDAGGQARTHYAVDVQKDGKTVARVIVLDTSSRSLQEGDAQQNPVEDETTWLQTALSRPNEIPAVVLTNTPTYSYGPGTTTDTETDATTLETLLVQSNATVVVTGRIGWNALYYATAPGIHCPQPGGAYPAGPPKGPGDCTTSTDQATAGLQQANGQSVDAQKQALKGVADALQPTGQQLPSQVQPQDLPTTSSATAAIKPLPFVVASGAGGKYSADARSTTAADGYWHGYTIVRVIPDTDAKGTMVPGSFTTVVEQRPVLDWVGITGNAHKLPAGRTLNLHGYGREAVGMDQPIHYDDVSTPAVTHRFQLFAADPKAPYLPLKNAAGGYDDLPVTIGSIDEQSGTISAGNGKYSETFAIARLTVGDKVATYPVVFEPRKSFRVVPQAAPIVAQAATIVAPRPPAPIVLSQSPASLPPSAPPPSVPTPGNLNVSLPSPGGLPPLGPAATPAATPPAPPAPPPPASNSGPTALQLTLNPPALNVPPQGSVIPPPAPPIQPAPPGGARKEARQKQAATAKSESSNNSEGAGESSPSDGGGGESAMTRRNTGRQDHYAFTAYHERPQASAWGRDLLYGGGITLMALLLAGGWTAAGPRARRRTPDVPAPAWQRTDRRGR